MDTISIVGGGIAGLAVAASLDSRRFDVTVYEKRADLPSVGTTLAMWPQAQRALDTIGILDEVRGRSPVIGSGAIRNAAGEPWVTLDGRGMIGVSRVELLRLLEAAVPHSVRRVTRRLDAAPSGTGLVVAADGVHSVVRRTVWGGAASARLTPYVAIRGILPLPVRPEHIGEYWGRGDLFGIGPAVRGTNWYAAYRSNVGPGGIDVASALELTRRRYAGHAPGIREVLADAAPELSLVQRIWTAPLLRNYVRGRVVLIGDAAHAMMPNLGRGACEALVDAVTLAELLNSAPLDEALAAYDRRRRLRTQSLSMASSALMRLALAEGAQPLRDRVLGFSGRRQRPAAVGSVS
jgi:2-polyprenyl-6-methoxyphenol hydroxylase-like FAD-dependent oxidoreductase